jgi:phosphoenolpyruvate synthase/pyruvate phosphate dikinase
MCVVFSSKYAIIRLKEVFNSVHSPPMLFIRPFTQLTKSDASIAGGKGASLGEMTVSGISVPPGFVILSTTFDQFLSETDLTQEIEAILSTVNHQEIHTVEYASEKIQALIKNVSMPEDISRDIQQHFQTLNAEYIAVRSSATAEDGAEHAWAGQLDSYLNTTQDTLLENVQRCWASLFTPRAIFYRFEKHLHTTQISVAVVVQQMIQSDVSGIAFSVHPVTEDHNQLIIEAGYGLGEAIVSGSITPDSYVVEKTPRKIIDTNIATQERGIFRSSSPQTGEQETRGNEWLPIDSDKQSLQKLTNEQILELSELVIKIENHYGFPCDIEWAFVDGKFYIVQSRPITTLSGRSDNRDRVQQSCPKLSDWGVYLQRQQDFFLFASFIRPYGSMLKEATNFGFNLQAHSFSRGLGIFYRSREEMLSADEYYLKLILNNDHCLTEWSLKGAEMNEVASKLIDTYRSSQQIDREGIVSVLKIWESILLYSTVIPYRVLSAVNYAFEQDLKKEQFEKVLNLYEPLRATTRYPQIMEHVFSLIWKYIGQEKKIESVEAISCVTLDELRVFCETGYFPSESELCDRYDGAVFWLEEGNDKVIVQTGLECLVSMGLQTPDDFQDELHGSIAHPGKTRGVVCIVNVARDMQKYNEGDIVVSINTSPSLMPILSTARAIVTDEGGIMCHAAIVSRELKKPCIIGTKIATQVLHDGDLVEVDADAGVVRVIERVECKMLDDHHGDEKCAIVAHRDLITLSKVYSREKPLFYFSMWNDSDRKGWEEFLDYRVQNNLFVVLPPGSKGSVWYPKTEIENISQLLKTRIKDNSDFIGRITQVLDSNWKVIFPYLSDQKKLKTVSEFRKYYDHLVAWWSAMNTVFSVPDMEDVSKEVRNTFLIYRADSEKYTEKMNKILLDFWCENFPDFQDLAFCVSPYEVEQCASHLGVALVNAIRSRKDGCILFNGQVYPLTELEGILSENNFTFEKISTGDIAEIHGTIAYQGKVIGTVKKISSFVDMKQFAPGCILVTEMTNPDYLPIMKVAGAIITDEGGVTCHASIASRELRTPCIIGTKIATQVLHDGDLVEVDADNGVVRVLEREGEMIYEVKQLEREDVDLTHWAYEFQQRSDQPVLLSDWFSRAMLNHFCSGVGIENKGFDYFFTDSSRGYNNLQEKERVCGILREKINNPNALKEILHLSVKIPQEFNKDADEVNAAIQDNTIENSILADYWSKMDSEFIKVIPWFWFPYYISSENMLTDKVKEGLEMYKEEVERIVDLDEALLTVIFPIKKTAFQLEQKDMSELVILARGKENFEKDHLFKKAAFQYLKKYDWITTFILTPLLPLTYEGLVERVKQALQFGFEEGFLVQQKITRRNEKIAKQIIAAIKGDQKLLYNIDNARELAYVLTAGIEEAYISSSRYLNFMQIVAERIGVGFQDMKFLLSKEVFQALRNDEKISEAKISERRKGYAMAVFNGKQWFSFGESGHAISVFVDKELNKADMNAKELRGQATCKGLVKGRVKIALTPDQAHALEEGEILVCSMTNPDYVFAMRKSSAVITDEGGLLSHAAIMSREFQKPCIIGTKIATQVLHDGDLVEVDADAGVVRIVERAV